MDMNTDAGDTSDEEATAEVGTGRRGQRLIVDGWLASHADAGTPGPHLRLRTGDGQDAVLRTDQVPAFEDALHLVAERIERRWEVDGAEYAVGVLAAPDPDDPDVARQRDIDRLESVERIAARLPEVLPLLLGANSTDEALVSVAALLGLDQVEVMIRLARFDLLALTRPARAARALRVVELRGEQPPPP